MKMRLILSLLPCLPVAAVFLASCIDLSKSGSSPAPGSGPDTLPPPELPAGFPAMAFPPDNPSTRQGVRLGRRLFHDPILSGDSTQSCATCHTQAFAFSDRGLRFSKGITGAEGAINASALVNPGLSSSQFWDGRAASLEEQALAPVPNPIEMNLPWPQALTRLRAHPAYPDLFAEAFGTREPDSMLVAKALAQFQRTFISVNSKFDQVRRGEASYTPGELRGLLVFNSEKGDCFHCHGHPRFGDGIFRNNGLDSAIEGKGRAVLTGLHFDNGKWKTPTLRNIALTGPYMHDGRFQTLAEVLNHYEKGIVPTPTVDPLLRARIDRDESLRLTEQDKADLIEFLHCLTDRSFLANPDLNPP